MSARRGDVPVEFTPILSDAAGPLRLTVPPDAVRVHKNGIEFRSLTPVPCWKEMTFALQSKTTRKVINCAGVIVACDGDCACGYRVQMIFTNISPQSQTVLNLLMSYSRPLDEG